VLNVKNPMPPRGMVNGVGSGMIPGDFQEPPGGLKGIGIITGIVGGGLGKYMPDLTHGLLVGSFEFTSGRQPFPAHPHPGHLDFASFIAAATAFDFASVQAFSSASAGLAPDPHPDAVFVTSVGPGPHFHVRQGILGSHPSPRPVGSTERTELLFKYT